ncbi:MAG TPA: hypothetical protein VK863_02570 [Candidatus Limnocylindrales bacterium]|nr:hypothetical protein [Candidatus Limnocylindrales bacterium]
MRTMASPSGEKIFGFSGPVAKAAAVSVLMVAVTVFVFEGRA